ncbi:putative polypeptide N-acetylgalactosaminyltransferase 10 [Apostichopus japonicus]|uniref:Putative polypeptide N-acetylgalactosaminyltransferase 10 n=1 Tax=Stichopus japonicus TaxID=307972 RepID=A0A2G8LJQ4_STIJA|nr:putative polypeptide N-acetylgalactosaminyltransferase 10 [Apostichopus japonicus]
MRQGPGEQGRKVELDAELKKTHREDVKANGFNERISNLVSLDRAVPDIRHPGCQTIKYLKDLPTASIVIPFHNEALSALKRTVHSVFNMSPPQLIKEIVLVDDFSNREYLKKELDDYMEQFPKVRILRNEMREGLIRTRLNGAKVAVGDVIIFLDSHCEANVNWLPPLLERIALNRKRIACPMIDVISNEDFHYETQAGDVMRGPLTGSCTTREFQSTKQSEIGGPRLLILSGFWTSQLGMTCLFGVRMSNSRALET